MLNNNSTKTGEDHFAQIHHRKVEIENVIEKLKTYIQAVEEKLKALEEFQKIQEARLRELNKKLTALEKENDELLRAVKEKESKGKQEIVAIPAQQYEQMYPDLAVQATELDELDHKVLIEHLNSDQLNHPSIYPNVSAPILTDYPILSEALHSLTNQKQRVLALNSKAKTAKLKIDNNRNQIKELGDQFNILRDTNSLYRKKLGRDTAVDKTLMIPPHLIVSASSLKNEPAARLQLSFNSSSSNTGFEQISATTVDLSRPLVPAKKERKEGQRSELTFSAQATQLKEHKQDHQAADWVSSNHAARPASNTVVDEKATIPAIERQRMVVNLD